MSLTDTIGKRIKYLRKFHKQNQVVFAETLGVSQAHLSNIEQGKDNPSEKLIRVISAEYNIDIWWLKHGDIDAFVESIVPVEQKEETKKNLCRYIDELDETTRSLILPLLDCLPKYFSTNKGAKITDGCFISFEKAKVDIIMEVLQFSDYMKNRPHQIGKNGLINVDDGIDELYSERDLCIKRIEVLIGTIFNLGIGREV